jgi:aerobic carbon-monoxide dehydrogenase large subunit
VTAGRFVGQRVRRREDRRLLTGHGTYVDDVELPGTLHAAFVRSNDARGTITALDVEEARCLDGVHAVLTADDLNDELVEYWNDMRGRPADDRSYPPVRLLARGDVRYVGEPVALVIADDRYVAEDACELVMVDVDPLDPVVTPEAALAAQAPLVHREWGSNVAASVEAPPDPELDAIFARAAHVVTETIHQHRYACVPMETRGLVASWDPYTEGLLVWLATQGPHSARTSFSRAFGLPESRVRVVMRDVGGGFGQKMLVMREELAVVAATRRIGRPVKWIEDRQENLVAGHHAREASLELSLALDGDGRILGMRGHLVENVGAYPFPGTGSSAPLVRLMLPGPYRVPHLGFTATAAYTNTCGRCPYRGPWMMETVAREQVIDAAARRLGLDPVELRRRNLIAETEQPYTTATGAVYEGLSLTESLDQALTLIDHAGFRVEQAAARVEGRLLGLGVAAAVEPTGMARGALGSEGAVVRVGVNGTVDVMVGCASHGQSLETTIVQVVADELGVGLDDVTLVQGDTASTPYGAGTGGSRSAVLYSGAARQASRAVRDKVVAVAAHLMEAAPEDLEVHDGVVSVRGTPARGLPLRAVAETAWLGHDALPAEVGVGLEASSRFRPDATHTYANATHACTVDVDPRTGRVDVLRYVVSEDCGVMINPTVVEGQIAGGVIQGIGGVLMEHMVYDDVGNPLTTTFLDYLVPTASEVPTIEYGHIETPAPSNPGGHKGMGEGGAIVSPPAVANAVADALAHLGVTIDRQPLDPQRVLALIDSAGDASGPDGSTGAAP